MRMSRWLFVSFIVVACDAKVAATLMAPDDAGTTNTPSDASAYDAYRYDAPTEPCIEPRLPSPYVPSPFKQPSPAHTPACTVAQADALICLFEPTPSATCEATIQDPANEDCFKCIYTDKGNKELGPIVIDGSRASLNTAGCMSHLAGDASSCIRDWSFGAQCLDDACDAIMPCADDPDGSPSCEEVARATLCAPYLDGGACVAPLLADGGAAHACASTGNFLVDAKRYAALFCVGDGDASIVDAGSDASDAATD